LAMAEAAGGGGQGGRTGRGGGGGVDQSTKLRKTTNLSTHLITVPTLPPTRDGTHRPPSGLLPAGMGEETVKEMPEGRSPG
jgi:hypothetical protein